MLYPRWCDITIQEQDNKQLWRLSERDGGRAAIEATLTTRIRAHYDNLDEIAEDVRELGYPGAAAILAERMPRSTRARSGELGEILASELVEEHLEFEVPIRRLRYKDGREMALRGDDFVGLKLDDQQNLHYLKASLRVVQTLPTPPSLRREKHCPETMADLRQHPFSSSRIDSWRVKANDGR